MRNTKKFLAILAMTAIVFSMTACGSSDAKEETNASASSEETEEKAEEVATVKTMAGEELQTIEDNKDDKENYLVIDVRSEEEYKAGHVKFAINMPIDTFEDNMGELDGLEDSAIVLVCNTGNKSGQVADILVKNGFTDVYNADGVKDYEYNLVTWGNVRADALQTAADDGSAFILDLRDAADYEAGHLKNAVNANSEDLAAVAATLPADKGAMILTYCNTGNKSAVAAQGLVDMGYTNVSNCLDGTKEVDFTFAE